MNIKTSDIYEAAYYLMYGARIIDVDKRLLPPNKQKKRGYTREWVIELIDVPLFIYNAWDSGYAYGDIRAYARMRKKVKKFIQDK